MEYSSHISFWDNEGINEHIIITNKRMKVSLKWKTAFGYLDSK